MNAPLKLADIPVLTDAQIDMIFGAGTAERQRLETWHKISEDGATARACGVPLDRCPPFMLEDMAISWKLGWYGEDKRRDPKGFELREKHRLDAAAIEAEGMPVSAKTIRIARINRDRDITCPTCGALPGRGCISRNKKPLPDEHASRRSRQT